MGLETYTPEKRVKLSKEETVPFLFQAGNLISDLGGFLGLIVSSFMLSIKSLFNTKDRLQEQITLRGKILDLRGRRRAR